MDKHPTLILAVAAWKLTPPPPSSMEGGGGEHLVEGEGVSISWRGGGGGVSRGGVKEQSLKTAQSVQGCFRQDRRVLF